MELLVEVSPILQVLSSLGLRLRFAEGRTRPLRSQVNQDRWETSRAKCLSEVSHRRSRPGASTVPSGSNPTTAYWPCPRSRRRTHSRCSQGPCRARVGVADADRPSVSRCCPWIPSPAPLYQCGSREVHQTNHQQGLSPMGCCRRSRGYRMDKGLPNSYGTRKNPWSPRPSSNVGSRLFCQGSSAAVQLQVKKKTHTAPVGQLS